MTQTIWFAIDDASLKSQLLAAVDDLPVLTESISTSALADLETGYSSQPDLLVLGPEHSHELRNLGADLARLESPNTRVLLVTDPAKLEKLGSTADQFLDEFVLAPVNPTEFGLRVRSALARAPRARVDRLRVGRIEFDRNAHIVFANGEALSLAPAEFRLITFFLRNPGRVFSRRELLHRAWGENVQAGERTVDVHIRRLRQILEPHGCADMIQTVRGFGYRFSDRRAAQLAPRNRLLSHDNQGLSAPISR